MEATQLGGQAIRLETVNLSGQSHDPQRFGNVKENESGQAGGGMFSQTENAWLGSETVHGWRPKV